MGATSRLARRVGVAARTMSAARVTGGVARHRVVRQEKHDAMDPRHHRKCEEPKRDSDYDRDGNDDSNYRDHR